jgi:LysR family transcriptional regulator, regulator for bpeEF and oprC
MDKFQAMQVFVRVVDSNSFTKAADILEITRTSVSNFVQHLETSLGVRLIQRTTRKLSLTPEGAEYYERCVRLLADLEDMEATVAFGGKPPRGKLRVDLPASLAKAILLPALPGFRNSYPDIELTMGATDRTVDLIEDGIDCVIRAGKLEESNLVARRVGSFTLVTCATPEYLKKYGEPATLQELERHAAVNYFFPRTGRIRPFAFTSEGQQVEVKLESVVNMSDADTHLACGLQGIGIFQSANFMVLEHVRAGRLKEVMTDMLAAPVPMYVLYPNRAHLSPKVRVFVDWVAEVLDRCPLTSGTQRTPASVAQSASCVPASSVA